MIQGSYLSGTLELARRRAFYHGAFRKTASSMVKESLKDSVDGSVVYRCSLSNLGEKEGWGMVKEIDGSIV